MDVLRVSTLSKYYGKLKAVDGLSFAMERGKVYGILGPNGSGKSTTLGMLLGVVNATAGDFQWFGTDAPLHKQLKKIGAIIEQPNFYPYMSAAQNLKLVCKIKNIDPKYVDEKLELVELSHRKKDKFKNYSLGMKQRLAIAAALVSNPEVLILDEPTNGLDPQGIHQIRELIIKVSQTGATILLASHLLDEVEKVCSEVIIIDNGRKIYAGELRKMNLLQNRLEVRIAPSEKDFVTFLKNYAGIKEFKKERDTYVLYLNDNISSSDISKNIFENGFVVTHFCLERPTLEQQFITLTQSRRSI